MDQNARVVIITGAGSGIGREVARQLGNRGHAVAALDQNEAGLKTLQRELEKNGQICAWRQADVTNCAGLDACVAEFENQLGPVEMLIACAGTAEETPALTMNAQKIEDIIRINLIGVSNTIAAVLPGMLTRRRGHITAISSLASLLGLPGQMAYCASKAGLNALMESLRFDVKDFGIKVTTVCPGWTRTAQTEGKYEKSDLMQVDVTAREILRAIDRNARVHAFPWWMVWEMRLLYLLPAWLRDYLVLRRIRQLKKR